MSHSAVTVEGLGKQYRIGAVARRADSLRDAVGQAGSRALRYVRRGGQSERTSDNAVWALRDVSFDLRDGEVLGIVGHNGAGKSTLLKILSRITDPSEGRLVTRGRVGSLLEVGTGFHPELTGRDNIYLNGSILGMDRAYIEGKFDEIVEFSGVDRFIDTPVKHYSSGMYLRLAFAVAAHLEPAILIIDEVLAVGDAEFQRKCIGKMGDVARDGRTILFVSHNLAAVAALCSRAVLLSRGRLVADGRPSDVIAAYSSFGDAGVVTAGFDGRRRHHHSDLISIVDAWMERGGERRTSFAFGDAVDFVVRARLKQPCRFGVELILRDQDQTRVVFWGSGIQQRLEFEGEAGEAVIRMRVDALPLAEGRFSVDLALAESGVRFLDYLESALTFHVDLSDPRGTGAPFRQGQGSIYVPSEFFVVDGAVKVVRP